jgi:histone arginine demethylase JMJD6
VDDSPLYIFDGSFAGRRGSRGMRRDYAVPELFGEDLLRLAGRGRRPPHRWFVMGPARSGSSLHVDPLATSAWNALLSGHKRWALFPPGTPRDLIKPPGVEREAASWFTHVWPRTQAPGWPASAAPIDVVQGPGETMFVPGGWWHCVMNLDLTVAVTQNFCSSANFPAVWRAARRGRPKMSVRWLAALRRACPHAFGGAGTRRLTSWPTFAGRIGTLASTGPVNPR